MIITTKSGTAHYTDMASFRGGTKWETACGREVEASNAQAVTVCKQCELRQARQRRQRGAAAR